MKKLIILILISAMTMTLLAAENYKKGEYYYEKDTHKLENINQLDVITRNGNIDIDKWSKNYIEIISIKRAKNEYDLEGIDIEKKTKQAHAYVKSVFNKSVIRNMSVDFDINIPSNVRVNLAETKNGNISIAFSDGDVSANTSNGNIIMDNINGSVDAKTSNGNIDVEAVTIGNIDTSNGNIKLMLRNISQDTDIESSNGNIKLTLKEIPSIVAELKTSMGKITLNNIDAVFSRDKKTYKEFTVGSGKYELNIETSVGNISLDQK